MEALATRIRHFPVNGLVVALWSGGALLAIALGVAAATSVTALAGLLGFLAASAVLAAAFMAPRWALIVLLFLLYSYAGWVASHTVGAPELSQGLLLIIIAALVWRQLTRGEQVSLPAELRALLALGLAYTVSAAFARDLGTSLGEDPGLPRVRADGRGPRRSARSPNLASASGVDGGHRRRSARDRLTASGGPRRIRERLRGFRPSPSRRVGEPSGPVGHSTPTSSVRCSSRPRCSPSTWRSPPATAPVGCSGSRHSPRASRRAPSLAPAGRSWPPPQPSASSSSSHRFLGGSWQRREFSSSLLACSSCQPASRRGSACRLRPRTQSR